MSFLFIGTSKQLSNMALGGVVKLDREGEEGGGEEGEAKERRRPRES